MSGIIGLYHLDGRPAGERAPAAMLDAIAHRGPDGAASWQEGPIGLGHRMLHTTPESLHERLPLEDATGHLVLTADARIDNRDELICRLDPPRSNETPLTDSALILAAYQKWGVDCPEYLLGDFAFALWDGREQHLFCARDHFGVKPFYYFASDRTLAFASEVKALFALDDVPRQINEERVGDYLASVSSDNASTFYQSIHRLPPAHRMVVNRTGIRLQSYWSLDPEREVRLDSDEAYASAFRELFTEAVRCRLRCEASTPGVRSAAPAGALLSGGLDSSSIACIARDLLEGEGRGPLDTFSSTYAQVPACDERPFIETVVAQGGITPHYIPAGEQRPLTVLQEMLRVHDLPFHAPNMAASWELCSATRDAGIRVLLDGHGGDEVVSHGYGYLKELAHARRWLTLAREARGAVHVAGDMSSAALTWGYFRKYRVDPLVNRFRPLRLLRRAGRGVARRLPGRSKAAAAPSFSWEDILDEAFVRRIGLSERRQRQRRDDPRGAQNERTRHFRKLTGTRVPSAFEALDRTNAAFAVEARYPFWDKRLVEFCLALPPEQKLHRGWSRAILRRAMQDVLPPAVQWRRDKTNFTPSLRRGLLHDRERLRALLADDLDPIVAYVTPSAVRRLYHRAFSKTSSLAPQEMFMIWKLAMLACWRRNAGRGQASPETEAREVRYARPA